MRIYIISDTHGYHDKLTIPEVDLVIHCGDFSNAYNPYENELQLRNALEWFSNLPIKYKVCTMGNHDTSFKGGLKTLVRPEEYPEINFLLHESIQIEGINIFGSPYSPRYGNWAFMYKRNIGEKIWSNIPSDTNILVNHSMPKYRLDLAEDESGNGITQVGCKALLNKVLDSDIKIIAGGHLHNSDNCPNYGILYKDNKTYINAACYSHRNNQLYNGHVIEI